MTREKFRDKKSKDYRKRRESYGIKDPVYLDEIEDAYYQGMVDADEHPQWISVEDELPEVGVAVLTITPRGTQRVGFYEDGWWLANFIDLVRMGSITHWMPLPSVENLKEGGEE